MKATCCTSKSLRDHLTLINTNQFDFAAISPALIVDLRKHGIPYCLTDFVLAIDRAWSAVDSGRRTPCAV